MVYHKCPSPQSDTSAICIQSFMLWLLPLACLPHTKQFNVLHVPDGLSVLDKYWLIWSSMSQTSSELALFMYNKRPQLRGTTFLLFLWECPSLSTISTHSLQVPLLYPDGNGSELPDDLFWLDLAGVPSLGSSDDLFMFQCVQKSTISVLVLTENNSDHNSSIVSMASCSVILIGDSFSMFHQQWISKSQVFKWTWNTNYSLPSGIHMLPR